ncbi:hypothetical protein CHLNCDRAFT_58246 [Chlorella variabilis]|uniref:EamA domain-containing protein n=1 Tax=Chlorella variabilis TaxID=554065 RepID=E1ZIH3_CHLVA|nr:hypothetical protein CHLNCDRAFT_58246 [Chlorella variabilis]EFN54159.1 hypothetical protein CHLNCDRAFT_58246 [Chlorella variabilis]|eukprot:XP_005846261.1 hypothetical protein CHLNCDRAFT_58246 [Chlorella variabilis]
MALCLPAGLAARRLHKWLQQLEAAPADEASEPLLGLHRPSTRGTANPPRSPTPLSVSPATSVATTLDGAPPSELRLPVPSGSSRPGATKRALMLRGSEIVFTAAISWLWLRRRLNRWHLAGIALCTAGITTVGAASLLQEPDSTNASAATSLRTTLLGMALVVAAEVVQAAQVVTEDFFLSSSLNLAPLTVVGVEGVWGTLLMFCIVLPAVQYLPGRDGGGIHEDSGDSLHMLAHSWQLRAVVACSIVGMGVYNVAGPHQGAQLGEPWTAHSWLQAVGFAILVVGTLVYGHGEEVHERRLHAKLRWARLRESVAALVTAHEARHPMKALRIAGPASIRTAFLERQVIYRLTERLATRADASPA